MNRKKTNELFWLPNILSMFRIILIPLFIYTYFTQKPFIYADLVVICLSSVTDVLDGKIARKFNLISETGKLLDPIADKLTQFSIVVILYVDGRIPFVLPLLIFVKEMFMLAGAIYIKKDLKENVLPSNYWGKSATFTFYVSAGLYLINMDKIAIYLLMLSILLLFIAFATYLSGFLRLKNKSE